MLNFPMGLPVPPTENDPPTPKKASIDLKQNSILDLKPSQAAVVKWW
jgi:hypothetical protein